MCIVLVGIDTYWGYEFVFRAHSTSVQTTIHGCTECLIYYHSIPSHSVGSH